MADVFVSYKRDQRAEIEVIAARLRDLGLSVWFDAGLTAGETFSDEIDREARNAKVILVCWSPAARDSRWVKAEGMIGFEHDKLATCYVAGPDKFSPPAPFNATHAEDLRVWLTTPNDAHQGWKSILRRIGRLCGRDDIEAWGGLGAYATSRELRAWLAKHESSPLFMSVDALLREREAHESDRTLREREMRERRAREDAERLALGISEPAEDAPMQAPKGAGALLLAAAFAAGLARLLPNALVAPMVVEFGISMTSVSSLFVASTAALVAGTLVAGALTDRSNGARAIAFGLVLAALASLLPLIGANYGLLLLSRIGVGFGAGLVLAPALAIAGRHNGPSALRLALLGAAATAAGLAISTLLSRLDNWRVSIGIVSVIVAIIGVVVLINAKRLATPRTETARIGFLSVSIVALLLATTVHSAFIGGINAVLPLYIRDEGDGGDVALFGVLSICATLAGYVLGGLLGAGAKKPGRYASVFIFAALAAPFALATTVFLTVAGGSPFGEYGGATTALLASLWFGVTFAGLQAMSAPGRYGAICALALALSYGGVQAGSLTAGAMAGMAGDLNSVLLAWSFICLITLILLVIVRFTIRKRATRVAEAQTF